MVRGTRRIRYMKSLCCIATCLLIMFMVSRSYAEPKRSYVSPDRKFKAVITAKGKECNESKVDIYMKDKLMVSDDYFSEDCDHGEVVEYAQWTRNSRFFVFSMYNSGGHQSWASSISFFDRENGKTLDLDKFLPPIADTKFILKAPDYVTLNIWMPFNADEGLKKSIILPVTFRLSDIVNGEKVAKKFYPNR